MIPVIIEDLINKVTDSKIHPEKRQHYAVTLKNIISQCEKALVKYDNDKLMKVK